MTIDEPESHTLATFLGRVWSKEVCARELSGGTVHGPPAKAEPAGSGALVPFLGCDAFAHRMPLLHLTSLPLSPNSPRRRPETSRCQDCGY
jgi:hypothetical protein